MFSAGGVVEGDLDDDTVVGINNPRQPRMNYNVSKVDSLGLYAICSFAPLTLW